METTNDNSGRPETQDFLIMLYRYFRAEVNEDGEVSGDVSEVNFTEERDRIREQIQEDLLCYFDNGAALTDVGKDQVCNIVVDNFKGFE